MEKAADMLFGLWARRLTASRQKEQELFFHPSCLQCCDRAMGLLSILYYFCSEPTYITFYKGTIMLSMLAFHFGHLLGVSLMTTAWNDPFGSFCVVLSDRSTGLSPMLTTAQQDVPAELQKHEGSANDNRTACVRVTKLSWLLENNSEKLLPIITIKKNKRALEALISWNFSTEVYKSHAG